MFVNEDEDEKPQSGEEDVSDNPDVAEDAEDEQLGEEEYGR
jgi:hypothetical protein